VTLTAHLHLAPWLRMSGTVPPLPQYLVKYKDNFALPHLQTLVRATILHARTQHSAVKGHGPDSTNSIPGRGIVNLSLHHYVKNTYQKQPASYHNAHHGRVRKRYIRQEREI
jgi:hypothetical protein